MELSKVFLGRNFYSFIYDPRKNKKEFANIIINIGINQICHSKLIVVSVLGELEQKLLNLTLYMK